MKKGIRPLLGDGCYEVKTTKGEGIMYYHEQDDEWYNVEIDGEIKELEGRVVEVGRFIPNQGTEEFSVH